MYNFIYEIQYRYKDDEKDIWDYIVSHKFDPNNYENPQIALNLAIEEIEEIDASWGLLEKDWRIVKRYNDEVVYERNK
jgi:hypothetical protein